MRGIMSAPFETSFALALLDIAQPIPSGIITDNAAIPPRRFAVYRNNVAVGLANALKSRFPVVEKIVGEEFFAAMAGIFVMEKPPRTPVLATYGDEFAGFIATFEPARKLSYLADVARLEAARTRAYHAADATPFGVAEFEALDASAVGSVRVDLHPSAEIVRSPHPIVTIWTMNSGKRDLVTIEDWHGEDALVVRPHLDVDVRLLPPGGAAFLLALAGAKPLGKAAAAALADHPEFDLTRNLVALIGSGLVRSIVVAEPKKHDLS
jgi:hypothetical protein